ncbi:D-erythronate dehydrogenase [Falsihalocynthiibacter arcticus]|uniref:NAD-dependent epimerase n=1 Tax=Falsihalocynthiibacter arcticus TaxID=1579316 RepID=A0A126UZ62_9RHOB|nr:D-erythronate dehydrogenase [Falsihalocynthiibacter arcticus]AML51351.1 NAD-dependent epimerase [Falsihalocynthiibacter arcticus]
MHVLIIGAAGMVGQKLTNRLAHLAGLSGREITQLTLADVVAPAAPEGFGGAVTLRAADITAPETALSLVAERPDVIFHLAAIVSGEAEEKFDKGYAINLAAFQTLLEAIRAQSTLNAPYVPRLVFTSSIAVFGAPFPDIIDDEFHSTPLTSYGTQKAICELLVNDYSRKGFVDGVGIRLPTVCIRPGKPNLAASGFFSNIMREPLIGLEAVLPVSKDVVHWHASPRSAVGFLIHAAQMDTRLLGARRSMSMPGLAASVGDQIAALDRVAGASAVKLIKSVPDEKIIQIVLGWPRTFAPQRAISLGFQSEKTFDEIIQVHIDDELGGSLP